MCFYIEETFQFKAHLNGVPLKGASAFPMPDCLHFSWDSWDAGARAC